MTDIDQLKKAFQQAIATSASVAASNEPLTRRDTVQAGQVFSAPVVQGGLGSWVASSGYPLASVTPDGVQLGAAAPSRNSFEMNPGLPGVPDVDFVPYNWNTNRFGGKGGALLGHPISWEVVGPTLKSPYCDWQWHVDTTGLTNDVITMETGPNPLLGAVPTVAEAYNCNTTTFDAEGGLYVLFTFTGDGFDGSLTGGRTAITGTSYRLRYELFRVGSIAGQAITLRGEKRIGDYFTGGGDGCRAITLIRPKVTRLAALPAPQNGQVQANRIFVFVPPEVSATSEYNPPYDDGVGGAGTWLGGGFDVAGALPAGLAAEYGGTNPLPIPRPVWESAATLDGGAAGEPNKWVINVASLPTTVPPIVRVYSVQRGATGALSNGEESNCLGYFYIDPSSLPPKLRLRRVPEINPDTGAVFWGDGPFDSGPGTVDLRVQFFESLDSLFLDSSLNYTKLAAARLTNLIDPRTAGPSIAYRDTSGTNAVPASKPDRAIFNTKPGEDPGNLLDLGFRAVYFPAKVDALLGLDAVPDFDNPIDSEDVQLTASPTSRQFIETDYSAGVAYLSETPDPANSYCQIAPTLPPFLAPNNPRQEIVLFAACVPYSMEEGQTGDGIRLTASSLASAADGFGDDDYADVYGRRVIFEPDVNQVLTPAPGASLTTSLTDLSVIPPSGFFFLVRKALGGLANRRGPYYYQSTSLTAGPPSVVSLDGISGPSGATAVNATGFTPDRIVLQRSLWSFDPTSASADTVRGSSKRLSTLSFKGADVTLGADGSVSVEPRTTLQKAYEAGRTVSLSSTYGGPIRLSSSENVNFGAILEIFRTPSVVTDGAGIAVTMGADTIAPGYFVSMDAAATGDGVRVTQDGSGDALRIYQNGAGYALDVISPAAIPVFYVDNAGTTSITDGTNFSVLTPTSVTVTDSVTNSSTVSITNVVVTDGTNTSTLDATSLVVTDSGAPANTSTVNTTSVSVTDGANTSTVDATSVTSGAFLYPAPLPSRTVILSFVGQMAAYGERGGVSRWDRGGANDQVARYLVSSSVNASTVLDLNGLLPEGSVVTDIRLRVISAAAGTLCELNYVPVTFAIVPQAVTTVASASTPGAGTQTLSLSGSLGGGHTVNKSSRDYFLLVKSNGTVIGDEIHGIEVTFNDPGPRNY